MSPCVTSAGKKEEKSLKSPQNDGNRSKRIYRRILTFIGVLFCACAIFLYVFDATPKTESLTVELGDDIPVDINEYLKGNSFSLKLAKFEMPDIAEGEPGDYSVYVRFLYHRYEFVLHIIDTHAPTASFISDNFVCEMGKEYDTLCFVESVTDACKNLEYRYINIDEDKSVFINENGSSFSISATGIYNIVLKITDSSGNYSTYYLPVFADTAPEISGVSDIYASKNSIPDLLYGVNAFDDYDGSTEVNAFCPDDCMNNPGTYEVRYVSTDSFGLSTEVKGKLHVYDALVLQDMVNTKKIDPFSGKVFGLLNKYDSGYIEKSDVENAVTNMKNSVVRIHFSNSSSNVNGSGYIVKIDEESIIICTNNHVTKNRDSVTVSFFDGLNVEGSVVAGQSAPDISFVSVPVSEIPKSELALLRTIHINLGYYKSLSDTPMFDMGMYCINEDGSEWLTRYGKVVRKSGRLAESFVGYDYNVTEVSISLTPGVSGSAIIDTHGNLLCMAAFYWEHDTVKEYYGVSLDDILDFYEKTFGERLEYY